ncbi:root phototropism protein 2 [Tanacetum coccineum]|uniref:Root phototropism protein 2 n=1 Tax=Tanacetum coccineum TaxID=301880 RepID=A0ABQ5H2I9_9ASTR
MTDQYCDGNLAGRTDDFLVQVALSSLSGAVVVLKSCEDLLPIAEQINIVQRCVEVASAKPRLTAIFLENDDLCKKQLEKRITAMLEHVTVDDLLVLSYTFDGESLFDLESVRRIISGFVEKEKSVSVFNGGDFKEVSSTAMLRVAKTVDAYLGEIATCNELSISKFNGVANLVPKNARKFDDDLYRAIDIFLKAHPNLAEIDREKDCSAMDPFKLSYEARVHASQNKRLPTNGNVMLNAKNLLMFASATFDDVP